jgi:hypothetical protein
MADFESNTKRFLGVVIPDDSDLDFLYSVAEKHGHDSDTQAYLSWLQLLFYFLQMDEDFEVDTQFKQIVSDELDRVTHAIDPNCKCDKCYAGNSFLSAREQHRNAKKERREDEKEIARIFDRLEERHF